VVPAAAEPPSPSVLLAQVTAPVLDVAGAVALRDVELTLGPGRFHVDGGMLFPARLEDGRTIELVFVGQARFLLAAPDSIEASQLELFTGESALDAPIEEAVIVLPPDRAGAELRRSPPPREVRPELAARARDIHARWLASAERKHVDVPAVALAGLLGDAAYGDYFTLWGRSWELGSFVFHLDPEDPEPVTLASFEPLDLGGWDRHRLRRQIRVQQRKGRWLGVRFEDLGAWDVWMSSRTAPDAAARGPAFEPRHYELDVTIGRDERRLAGKARVRVTARDDGRRLARFELMPDLVVSAMRDGDGHDLHFFRSGTEVLAVLPRPTVAGEEQVIEIDWAGHGLAWVDRRTWDLLDTSNWHPHCGELDRATYDVTLRWPRKHHLVASGTLVAHGSQGGMVWERRRIDLPSMAFTFALGRYHVERQQVGDVALEVAFDRTTSFPQTDAMRQAIVDRLADALGYYEEAFGPYPLSELKVVTVDRDYSQSFLGFIALANGVLRYVGPDGDPWLRDLVIAHELAHQWWGNHVGWRSYRDQWLSEGMANYAALLYSSRRTGGNDALLGVMSAGWRRFLSQTTSEGRTLESLGPVVLGVRLNSSRAENGYRSIVYRKGAVVLAMLARAVGEDRFLELLKTIAAERANDVLTTEEFLATFASRTEMDIDGFSRQYVYGTGIPHVYYDYSVDRAEDEGWIVRGEVRMLSRSRMRHEVIRLGQDRWDVVARLEREGGPEVLMVPYRLTSAGDHPADGSADGGKTWSKERARAAEREEGRVFVRGPQDAFVLETKWRPRDLQLDPAGEILAWFHAADRTPREFLTYRAEDLALQGRTAEAEQAYLEALALPPDPDPRDDDPASLLEQRSSAPDYEGVRIRFALSRLRLDQGREDEVEAHLAEIEDILRGDDTTYRLEREVLASRIDLRRGEADRAYRRLGRTLRLAFPVNGPTESSRLWRWRLGSTGPVLTEALALFGIAARAVGDEEESGWALREAAQRGVSGV
jgi:hypothetical protein